MCLRVLVHARVHGTTMTAVRGAGLRGQRSRGRSIDARSYAFKGVSSLATSKFIDSSFANVIFHAAERSTRPSLDVYSAHVTRMLVHFARNETTSRGWSVSGSHRWGQGRGSCSRVSSEDRFVLRECLPERTSLAEPYPGRSSRNSFRAR